MKKFLLSTIALLALGMAAPVAAADLSYKAPPPVYVPPVYSWAGFYIGINGGWGDSRHRFDWMGYTPIAAEATGGTVGGQIGYNWQSGSWVFGIEAQGNWANFSNTYTDPFNLAWSVRSQVDAFGLFTGRVGYAANNALFYIKGGAAVASNDYTAALNNNAFIGANSTRWGADIGVGFEYGFAPNWSVGAEYNHLFLGHQNFNWTNPAWRYAGVNVGQDIDLITVRVNYRFGGPGY